MFEFLFFSRDLVPVLFVREPGCSNCPGYTNVPVI